MQLLIRHLIESIRGDNDDDTHPLMTFQVFGTIVSVKWKTIRSNDYLFLRLDDNSNFNIKDIQFKCPQWMLPGYDTPGSLVNVSVTAVASVNKRYIADTIEINIEEILNTQLSVSQQINFWKHAIRDYAEWNTPTAAHGTDDDFLEKLQLQHITNNLQITSPYLPPIVSLVSDVPELQLPSLSSGKSLKQIRQALLECIIEAIPSQTPYAIGTFDLYEIPTMQSLITSITTYNSQQRNSTTFETLKTEQFMILLNSLQDQQLIVLRNNNNIIDVTTLHVLLSYTLKRLLLFIKLNCLTGTIDTDFIKQKLKLPYISDNTIIKFFKFNLTIRQEDILKNWYFENKSKSIWILHLEYI